MASNPLCRAKLERRGWDLNPRYGYPTVFEFYDSRADACRAATKRVLWFAISKSMMLSGDALCHLCRVVGLQFGLQSYRLRCRSGGPPLPAWLNQSVARPLTMIPTPNLFGLQPSLACL
jgi:hypothetical protein